MSPQNDTTIDWTITSVSDLMSVDNTDNESVLTRAPIETPKPYYKHDAPNSYSSRYNPRTASASKISPSFALPVSVTQYTKTNKKIESMK